MTGRIETEFSVRTRIGHRSPVVDQAPMLLVGDIPVAVVDKETGEFTTVAEMVVAERIDDMTDVSLSKAEIAQ